ncbi:1244_t:CDS:1 [Diversispora eburnea]|uniref:1244_t:CDS:1 n=1 Tax=Diversispora eburnea TaxID=1213867 RepID=A0A9N9GYH0_9GLOM|nr:1244_t:CDS:1 [Diversispora eburnea]
MFVDTLVEGKTLVKALINTSSKFNTISKRLFDKLEEDYGLESISGDDLIGAKIKCLDLQFCYKGKWRSLDGTEVIDFQICKNPSFDLVLGQEWLWMHKVKIIFGFSPRTYEHCDKIVIDNMSIPLIEGDGRPMDNSKSHKTSSGKNNSSNSAKSKADLIKDEITNMINKILSDAENNKYRKRHHKISRNISPAPPRRLDDDVPENSRASKNKKYPKVDLGDGCGKFSLKTHLNNIWKSVHFIENDIYYGIFKRLFNIENELRGGKIEELVRLNDNESSPSNSRLRQNKSKKGGVKYSTDSDTDTSDTSTSYSSNSGSEDVCKVTVVKKAKMPQEIN